MLKGLVEWSANLIEKPRSRVRILRTAVGLMGTEDHDHYIATQLQHSQKKEYNNANST
jgi:hypothetical protein